MTTPADSQRTDRPLIPNLIVLGLMVITMAVVPVRKLLRESRDPYRLAQARGQTIVKALNDSGSTVAGSNSTEVLRAIDPTLKIALLPGGPATNGPEGNAWSVVADIGPAFPPDGVLLLSHNIMIDRLSSLTGRVADTLSDLPPFGRKAALIVTRRGTPLLIQGGTLEADWSIVVGSNLPPNRVLRP